MNRKRAAILVACIPLAAWGQAPAGDAAHGKLVVRTVVVHDEEQRDPVIGRGPQDARRIHEVAASWNVTVNRPFDLFASAAPREPGAQ